MCLLDINSKLIKRSNRTIILTVDLTCYLAVTTDKQTNNNHEKLLSDKELILDMKHCRITVVEMLILITLCKIMLH